MRRSSMLLGVLSLLLLLGVAAYAVEDTTWGKLKSTLVEPLPAAKANVTTNEIPIDFFGFDLLSNGETGLAACGEELDYDPDQPGNLILIEHIVELPNGKTNVSLSFRETTTATAISNGTAYEISGRQANHINAVSDGFTFSLLAKPVDGPGPVINLRANGNFVVTPSGQVNFQGVKEGEACSGP